MYVCNLASVMSPFQILFNYVYVDVFGFAVVAFKGQVDIWALIVMWVCTSG